MRHASNVRWLLLTSLALALLACADTSSSSDRDGSAQTPGGKDDGAGGSGGNVSLNPFPQYPGAGSVKPFVGGTMECFFGPGGGSVPAAAVEYVLETIEGQQALHTRLTLNPGFVDNTYGANAIGWTGKRGHTFEMLYRSDHAQILFANASTPNSALLDVKIDYLSASGTGYRTLGIAGGDGALISGSASDVLKTQTSISENFNERGYSQYTVDSPATTANYDPNPAAPTWDFRVVYEAWIRASLFNGRARAFIDHIHASPSKGDDTLIVSPGPCPPSWNVPTDRAPGGSSCTSNAQCASYTCQEGKCFGEGSGGGGGSTPSLPGGAACQTNGQCASLTCVNGACITEVAPGAKLPGGSACSINGHCASLTCVNGQCLAEVGPGGGGSLPPGAACATNAQCASLDCRAGACFSELPGSGGGGGGQLPGGTSCSLNSDCLSRSCVNNVCLNEVSYPNGAPCSTNAQCESLTCEQGACASGLL